MIVESKNWPYQLKDSAADSKLKLLKDGEVFGVEKPGGEKRIHIGTAANAADYDQYFFPEGAADVVFEVSKLDLLQYLLSAKEEFLHPSQSYRMPIRDYFEDLFKATIAIVDDIFYIRFVKNCDAKRYYIARPTGDPLAKNYFFISNICLPLVSQFNFIRNRYDDGTYKYYLKPIFIGQTKTLPAPNLCEIKTLQQIFYGAPGSGKSHKIKKETEGYDVIRTTFHPDSDYSTFVGAYKPVEIEEGQTQVLWDYASKSAISVPVLDSSGNPVSLKKSITYKFVKQAFIRAYLLAWKKYVGLVDNGTLYKSSQSSKSMPAPSSVSPYTSSGAGTVSPYFDRESRNGYDLNDKEENLLRQVDAFLFPFIGVECFADIHKDLKVYIDNKTNDKTKTVLYLRSDVEREIEELRSRLGEYPNDSTIEGQRFYQLKNILYQMGDADSLEVVCKMAIWGLHSKNSEGETVTIYKGQIEQDCFGSFVEYGVVATYIHEMFHAYFNTSFYIPEIEEAVVECSTLCFLELLSNSLGGDFVDILNWYKDEVEKKKNGAGFAYYGFGSYLFNNRSLDWISLLKNARIDVTSQDVNNYRKLFAGLYPSDERMAMEALYRILTATSTCATNASPKAQFLIIEEINRGNCAQIFGDLFQLLDRQDNGFSEYPIETDSDMQQAIQKAFAEEEEFKLPSNISVDGVVQGYKSVHEGSLSSDIQNGHILLLPNNLFIWATMNTSDQSLFPIDSAFKRRWDWEYVPVDHDDAKRFHIILGESSYNWDDFIVAVNQKVFGATQSADKQLGNRFCKKNGILNPEETDETKLQYKIDKKQLIGKVMFYLWEEVCKDAPEDEMINFMRRKKNPSDKDSTHFVYQDLYNSDVDTILKEFMNYLGVNDENKKSTEAEVSDDAVATEETPAETPVEE